MMQYLLYVGYAVPLRCADVLVICSLFSVVVFLFHYVCDGTMVNPNRKGTKKPKNTIANSLPSPDGDAIMHTVCAYMASGITAADWRGEDGKCSMHRECVRWFPLRGGPYSRHVSECK